MANASGNTFLVLVLSPDEESKSAEAVLEIIREQNAWDFDTAIVATDYQRFSTIRAYERNGSSPACCGNGLRIIAHLRYEAGKSLWIKFGDHDVEARHVFDDRYEVRLGTLNRCRINADTLPDGLHPDVVDAFCAHDNAPHVYSVCGEPHIVLFHKPNQAWLTNVGSHFARTLNVNVTIADVSEKQAITAMTFERGVGRIVKSSGTGACAAAYACRIFNPFSLLKNLLQLPSIQVMMNGHVLTVNFYDDVTGKNGELASSEVALEGPVTVIFKDISKFIR